MRVVAGDAAIQPDDFVDAQVIMKRAFQLAAAEAGIARLYVGEQALFSGEQLPCPIHVDAAAFEHQSGFDPLQL